MDLYVPIYILMLVIWPVYEPRKLMPVIPFIYLYLFSGISLLIGLLPLRFGWAKSADRGRVEQRGSLRESLAVRLIGILLIVGQVPPTME